MVSSGIGTDDTGGGWKLDQLSKNLKDIVTKYFIWGKTTTINQLKR
jgi:hypothetical protein